MSSSPANRDKLLALLARGSETQLHQVRSLVQEESALLIRQPLGFTHAALFMAVEQNCRDEVILYLLNDTLWYTAQNDFELELGDNADDNNNEDSDAC